MVSLFVLRQAQDDDFPEIITKGVVLSLSKGDAGER